MLYQLPNGKVVEISTEQYIELSDEELQYLLAFNYGDAMEDPWFGSIIKNGSRSMDDDEDVTLMDATETPEEQKLDDLDVDHLPDYFEE